MNIKEYREKNLKSRTKHIKLPSGLEFDIVLPSPYQMVFGIGEGSEIDKSKRLLDLIVLPDKLEINDLTMNDFLSLMEQVTDFFTKETKSLTGSKNMQKK